MAFEYINDSYNLNVKKKDRVLFQGSRMGTVVKDCGNYVGVIFDDDPKKVCHRLHPTWEIIYNP